MRKIDLLESFPKAKRTIEPGWRTETNIQIAKRFDKEFFDGDRVNGYGGYYYDGRWKGVVKKLQELYQINKNSSILDIGCAKGFLLYDLMEMIPGIQVAGIDISEYAVNHAMQGFRNYLVKNGTCEDLEQSHNLEEIARARVLPHMIIGNAEKLPWPDHSFDVVLSINTTHNLPEEQCKKAIGEMLRVGRKKENMFIQVDAYSNNKERQRMKNWVLTAETMLSADEWLNFFTECNYNGDYFWTTV